MMQGLGFTVLTFQLAFCCSVACSWVKDADFGLKVSVRVQDGIFSFSDKHS